MKRQDIVKKLMGEGMTEKTLANMTDKQLNMLSERFLSEQMTAGVQQPIVNVSKTDMATQNSIKQQKKPFATYESEMKEEFKPDKEGDKAIVIKRLKFKIEHEKNEDKVKVFKRELDKLESKKKDMKEEFKSKTEWLKSKGIIKDDSKKEEDVDEHETEDYDDDEEKSEEVGKKMGNTINKHKSKDKSETKDGGSEYKKRVSSKDFSYSLNEWVDKLVGKNVHPFTSKNEIMNLIKVKLNESPQHAPQQDPAEPDVEVEPGKREAPGIDPDDPFRDPHPGINPGPKAKKKIKLSAENAKNKIIELLKKKL